MTPSIASARFRHVRCSTGRRPAAAQMYRMLRRTSSKHVRYPPRSLSPPTTPLPHSLTSSLYHPPLPPLFHGRGVTKVGPHVNRFFCSRRVFLFNRVSPLTIDKIGAPVPDLFGFFYFRAAQSITSQRPAAYADRRTTFAASRGSQRTSWRRPVSQARRSVAGR